MGQASRRPLLTGIGAAFGMCVVLSGCQVVLNVPQPNGPGSIKAPLLASAGAPRVVSKPAEPLPPAVVSTSSDVVPVALPPAGSEPIVETAALPKEEPIAMATGSPSSTGSTGSPRLPSAKEEPIAMAPNAPSAPAAPMPGEPASVVETAKVVEYDTVVLTAPAGAPCPPAAACAPLPNHFFGVPRELDKVTLPDYVVEPPDVLYLNTISISPMAPYRIESGDVLAIQFTETLPNEPIAGHYAVEPDGSVNLGYSYRSVRLAGLTVEEARDALETHLIQKVGLKAPKGALLVAQSNAIRMIPAGEHLVKMDGTINLGIYGCVYTAGLNLAQIREAIEARLAHHRLKAEVAVDVLAYNSKVYYVIFDGAGCGQQVVRLPITGNETVLDAVSHVNGLPAVACKKRIWVARPNPCEIGCDQILPVDWRAITEGASTGTNYQILPGDRVYVKGDRWIDRLRKCCGQDR